MIDFAIALAAVSLVSLGTTLTYRAAERRADEASWRAWHEGLPGLRYGARLAGTTLVYLGKPPMTVDEARAYCDTHPDYEVVVREVIHTDWVPAGEVSA